MGGQKMSTQLQEIIVDNSIRSFNQGYNVGRREEQARIVEILEEHKDWHTEDVILLIKVGTK
jgi:hypothetical protein